jgi:hypothetical protein
MIEITQGDKPTIVQTCVDENGVALDLTSCSTATLHISVDGAPALARAMVINSPATAGIVQYQFVSADTAVVGNIEMEIVLAFADGTVITSSPIDDDIVIRRKMLLA